MYSTRFLIWVLCETVWIADACSACLVMLQAGESSQPLECKAEPMRAEDEAEAPMAEDGKGEAEAETEVERP